MLRAIGSLECPSITGHCCDVCNTVPDTLQFEACTLPTRRKRRSAVREVDKELQVEVHDRLLKERDVFIEEHPQFKMVGPDFVVPVPVIDDICSNLRFITTQDGLCDRYDIRPDIKCRLFNVLMEVLRNAPSAKRRCLSNRA